MSRLSIGQPVSQPLPEAVSQPVSEASASPTSPLGSATVASQHTSIESPPTSQASSSLTHLLAGMSLSEFCHKATAALRARWYLRRAQSLGPRSRVWGRPSIQIWGNMNVGDRVQFVSTIAKLEIVVSPNATLDIGDGVFINYGTSIAATRYVKIGARTKLGTHVILMDNDFHHLDPDRRLERPESAPIILEENVWLAARVIVVRGVTIGENSVIGAGSVVTRDIPPNVFAAGVPAKVIRSL